MLNTKATRLQVSQCSSCLLASPIFFNTELIPLLDIFLTTRDEEVSTFLQFLHQSQVVELPEDFAFNLTNNYVCVEVCMSKISQELRMLSSVTLNCQVTKIVMNSGSQLSESTSTSTFLHSFHPPFHTGAVSQFLRCFCIQHSFVCCQIPPLEEKRKNHPIVILIY